MNRRQFLKLSAGVAVAPIVGVAIARPAEHDLIDKIIAASRALDEAPGPRDWYVVANPNLFHQMTDAILRKYVAQTAVDPRLMRGPKVYLGPYKA